MTDKQIQISDEYKGVARHALERACAAANNYDGAEDSYEGLLKILIAFDECAKEIAQQNKITLKNHTERCAWEKTVSRQAQPEFDPVSIDDLMMVADNALTRAMKSGKSKIKIIKTDFCFLPTHGQSPFNGTGDGAKVEVPRIDPRREWLILALQARGVYADDILIFEGKNRPEMVRQKPYYLVQIPRLDREIVICDEVGEATFVGQGQRGPLFWATYSKEQLEHQKDVSRITAQGDWIERIIDSLFTDNLVREKTSITTKGILGLSLTNDLIIIHALMYAAKHGGKLPTNDTKEEIEGLSGQTWKNWDKIIRRRHSGLSGIKFKGLADLFCHYGLKIGQKENHVVIRRACENLQETGSHGLEPVGKIQLTYDIILHKAIEYAAQNNGKLPTNDIKEEIEGFPGQRWKDWDAVTRNHSHGLPNYGFKGLANLFRHYGLKMGRIENPEAIKMANKNIKENGSHGLELIGEIKLTYDLILRKAIEYAAANNWALPKKNSGAIEGFPGQTWVIWSYAIRQAFHGLPDNGMKGLADLFCHHGLKIGATDNYDAIKMAYENMWIYGEHGLDLVGKTRFNYDLILRKAIEYAAEHNGKLPVRDSGEIKGFSGQTWNIWSQAIKRGSNGLPNDGLKGLADLFKACGLKDGNNKENLEAIKEAHRMMEETGSHNVIPLESYLEKRRAEAAAKRPMKTSKAKKPAVPAA